MIGGLFCAAPLVAIATLVLTIRSQGAVDATAEAHYMLFGAIAFFVYAALRLSTDNAL